MALVKPAPVIRLPLGRDRYRSVARLAEAGRRTADAGGRTGGGLGGRAWINGREVGGADHRYAHLARSYD